MDDAMDLTQVWPFGREKVEDRPVVVRENVRDEAALAEMTLGELLYFAVMGE